MFLLTFFEKYLIYSVETQNGRTDYYYYDEITWIVGLSFVLWLIWFLIKRAAKARGLIRKPKIKTRKSDSQALRAKNDLSRKFLKKGISENIHAVGIGKLFKTGEVCIQVFITDRKSDVFCSPQDEELPDFHQGIPVIMVQMPTASFLGADIQDSVIEDKSVSIAATPIRGKVEKIMGGISGANVNLTGQSGTIGYLCKKRSIFPRKTARYLLSNTHVFADLRTGNVDDSDLIVQPSPGESERSEPIGALVDFSDIKLDNDIDTPNSTDAAIAKLWKTQQSENLIPMIGKILGFAKKEDVQIGEYARKFGRTTGFTEGSIFSKNLDIWIRYDRTGQKAFFNDQFLIEPNDGFDKFVDKGDSGSLVVDGENYASGLIFAGASTTLRPEDDNVGDANLQIEKRIDNFGVANPISDVFDRFKLEIE